MQNQFCGTVLKRECKLKAQRAFSAMTALRD